MRGVLCIGTALLVMGVVASVAGINPPMFKSEGNEAYANTTKGATAMTLEITSSAFSYNEEIPSKYTCDGEDISPALEWSGLPEGTKSIALIVDDPDAPDPAAPKMTWVHWVLYNIPPSATGLPEAVKPQDLPKGTKEGLNDWQRTGYGGPCPPIGRHRYFHKLYALDAVLPDLGKPTKKDLEKAIQAHILAKAEMVGTYQRNR
jgi:Raf kinase inhibitor-like YbhB/YbcL family protein